jgi:hypothetical protein
VTFVYRLLDIAAYCISGVVLAIILTALIPFAVFYIFLSNWEQQ